MLPEPNINCNQSCFSQLLTVTCLEKQVGTEHECCLWSVLACPSMFPLQAYFVQQITWFVIKIGPGTWRWFTCIWTDGKAVGMYVYMSVCVCMYMHVYAYVHACLCMHVSM